MYNVTLYCTVILAGEESSLLSSIMRLKHSLTDLIEPEFGLFDQLLGLEVLTRRQYNKVRAGDKATYERCDDLLDLLTSEDQCEKVIKALQKTSQQHVVNYITQHGGLKHTSTSLIIFQIVSLANKINKINACLFVLLCICLLQSSTFCCLIVLLV